MKKDTKELVVALDIGTSKVLALVGEVADDGSIDILGMGEHVSRGLRKGVVANIESTVESIQRAIDNAELNTGCTIGSVYCGIAGAHVNGRNSSGVVGIRDGEVRESDIERVMESARALAIPNDQKILHILPQDFIIDNQEGIHQPVGMSGVRLEAKVHIVTCAVSAEQNITKCVQRCNLAVDSVILEQVASSEAVLTDDERELGVCLIDIGAGTTDIAIFSEGAIRHTKVLPIAGNQVTSDLAIALRTPSMQVAEEIKVKHGCALASMAGDDMVEVPSQGDRQPRELSRHTLADVIEARFEELFHFVHQEIRNSGFEELLGAGIVITGGSASIEGIAELAEEIFHKQVRIGVPLYSGKHAKQISEPKYATSVGLLEFGYRQRHQGASESKAQKKDGVFSRLGKWAKNNF